MKKIIWRSRVTTILGFLILILAFDGFPDSIHNLLLVVLGGLIIFFGFSGNKYANNISQKYTLDDDDYEQNKIDKEVPPVKFEEFEEAELVTTDNFKEEV